MLDMRKTRSLLERAKDIFELIKNEDKPFPKSKFKEIGLNPDVAENWLDLIVYIQTEEKIRLVKTDNSVIVEKTSSR